MIDDSLDLFRDLADSSELAPTILGIGEVLIPEPAIGTHRLVFQETFVPFQDVTCAVALGYALANRGMIRRVVGQLDAARRDMVDALDLFRAIGDERAIAHGLGRLGNLAAATGEFAEAREQLEECLAIRRRIGDSRGTGLAQANLGNLAVAEGDPPSARVLLEESAAAFRRRGDMWGYGAALGNLASLAIAEADLPLARRQPRGEPGGRPDRPSSPLAGLGTRPAGRRHAARRSSGTGRRDAERGARDLRAAGRPPG